MPHAFTSREAYIALNMLEQVGPVRTRKLIAALGSPEAIFSAGEDDLIHVPGIGRDLARTIRVGAEAVDPAAEEAKAKRLGLRVVTFLDADYPEALKEIHDPPLVLYCQGELAKADRHGLAIVGTRHATHYGSSVADRLAYGLSKAGFTIISGLARGIDTVAHQAALKAGGRTLAVLGGAIDKFYPPENRELGAQIARQGAVLSEYPLGRSPDRQTFPYRNRIVAGMATGLIVVEAGEKSGAVITANEALEQGRHVYAVPGRIDNPSARGCHALIKTGAKLVETLDDIIDDLQWLIPKKIDQNTSELKKTPDIALGADEVAVVKALGGGGLQVDELARACGLAAGKLNALLLGLEMKRVLKVLPGRLVELREGLLNGK
ncbi:MAG TPA: DNA-processing protein DprA [Kiritimatiellia bacterium]|nr:DNA-processing protein DprA [Kiritimatiellia bacterium]HMO98229.1 DNA-processing protein DprA [Kiritimatiellia bacterium]HMP97194.1 DNA-processing protein DprA [Kiritimatiellia bacterium]